MVQLRSELTSKIKQQLQILGYSQVAVTGLQQDWEESYFLKWLEQKQHASMHYLERRSAERIDPKKILANTHSIIVAIFSYNPPIQQDQEFLVAAYAQGEDYHEILNEKLLLFKQWFEENYPKESIYTTTDTGPVLEKLWAKRAGLGWMGKHTNMIDAKAGSYFFLSVILTSLDLATDQPMDDHCGKCDRCITICPTQAIVAPYQLNAGLCISYLTIEHRGIIPVELRKKIGNHLFGCDDCQTCCPWNRFAKASQEIRLQDQNKILQKDLGYFLQLSSAEFKKIFKDSPILRVKYEGFLRNCLIVAANIGAKQYLPLVRQRLQDPSPIIREHAVWALQELALI